MTAYLERDHGIGVDYSEVVLIPDINSHKAAQMLDDKYLVKYLTSLTKVLLISLHNMNPNTMARRTLLREAEQHNIPLDYDSLNSEEQLISLWAREHYRHMNHLGCYYRAMRTEYEIRFNDLPDRLKCYYSIDTIRRFEKFFVNFTDLCSLSRKQSLDYYEFLYGREGRSHNSIQPIMPPLLTEDIDSSKYYKMEEAHYHCLISKWEKNRIKPRMHNERII